jgi:uncharacterized protein (TIGR02147 family)
MDAQTLLQKTIREAFDGARMKNPSLSMRSFASRIGMDSGALSSFLAGKRRISQKLAVRIAHKLLLKPSELKAIEAAFSSREAVFGKMPLEYSQLSSDQFEILSDWIHFALLSMVKLKSFVDDPKWIAARLGVGAKAVEQAIERLIRLKLLARSPSGRLQRTKTRISTSDGIQNTALRRDHMNSLELARRSMEKDALELCDFSSITMPTDPQKLSDARDIIRRFQDELSQFLEQGRTTEVYRLCVHLFPLTQPS